MSIYDDIIEEASKVDETYIGHNQMRPEDHAHVERVILEQDELIRAKYEAGRKEHGGDCWRKPGMLAHALDESADLPVYLRSLRDQMLDLMSDCEREGLQWVAERVRHMIYK